MEKIDINNYEAYFLDFMEGTLSAEEKYSLNAFLEKHPALKTEMEEDFGEVQLFPETISFEDKNALKIDENKLILTLNTIESVMVASIEGQLSNKHQEQLNTYIQSENLEKTFAYYKATILKADTAIVFEEKKKLKVKTGLIISMPFITKVASIAAVGLLLIMLTINWNDPTDPVHSDNNTIFAADAKQKTILNSLIKRNELNDSNDNFDLTPIKNIPNYNNYKNQNDLIEKELNNAIANKEDSPEKEDPSDNLIIDSKDTPLKEEGISNEHDFANKPIKEEEKQIENNEIIENKGIDDDDVAISSIIREEPYKLVTNLASEVLKQEIKFTRDKDIQSKDYVAYSFKIGSFGFERKKSR